MEILSHNTTTSNGLNWDLFTTTVILEVKRGDRVFTSTGVLLNDRALITAAHSVDCADEVKVIISHDYNFITETYQVEKCYIHPEYNPSQSLYENDLAILFLKQNIGRELQFYSLVEMTNLNDFAVLERIGFGNRANTNKRTWTNPQFQELSFNRKTIVLEDRYSFIGDSGGPIYQNLNGHRVLVGIHSTKEAGNRTYAVNLAEYKNWIESLLAAA